MASCERRDVPVCRGPSPEYEFRDRHGQIWPLPTRAPLPWSTLHESSSWPLRIWAGIKMECRDQNAGWRAEHRLRNLFVTLWPGSREGMAPSVVSWACYQGRPGPRSSQNCSWLAIVVQINAGVAALPPRRGRCYVCRAGFNVRAARAGAAPWLGPGQGRLSIGNHQLPRTCPACSSHPSHGRARGVCTCTLLLVYI